MTIETKSEMRAKALSYLARREHSRFELTKKLSSKASSEELSSVVDAVMDELEADNLLSDDRCAEMLIRSGYSRGHGPIKIFQSARGKAIDQSKISGNEAFLAADWFSLAAQVREKRFGSVTPDDYQDKAKQARFLAGRGFNQEQIEFALSCVLDAE